jgi:hypothetical protein
MALLAHQQITITGATITLGATAASDTVNPDDRLFLWYKNTNAATRDITIVVPGTYYAQNLADVTVTIAATTGEELIGPIDTRLADPTTGLVTVNHSATAGLTVAAVKI